jgi:hypothetical protein
MVDAARLPRRRGVPVEIGFIRAARARWPGPSKDDRADYQRKPNRTMRSFDRSSETILLLTSPYLPALSQLTDDLTVGV